MSVRQHKGWWLLGLLVTAGYLVAEVLYNYELVDFLADGDAALTDAHAIEAKGRRLAALGAAILVTFGLYLGTVHLKVAYKSIQAKVLSLVVMGCLGVGAFTGMYWMQGQIIEEVVERQSPEGLRNAYLIQLYRHGLMREVFVDDRFGGEGSFEAKLSYSKMSLLMHADGSLIAQISDNVSEAYCRSVQREHLDNIWPGVSEAHAQIGPLWNAYLDATLTYDDQRISMVGDMRGEYNKLMREVRQRARGDDPAAFDRVFNRHRARWERSEPQLRALPRPWDFEYVSFHRSMMDDFDRRGQREFSEQFQIETGCQADFRLGMTRSEFWQDPGLLACVDETLGEGLPFPLSRIMAYSTTEALFDDFFIVWSRDQCEEQIERANAFSLEAFTPGAGAYDHGVDSVKLLYVAPIAIVFSAVFAFVNAISLAQGLLSRGLGGAWSSVASFGAAFGLVLWVWITEPYASGAALQFDDYLESVGPWAYCLYKLFMVVEYLVYSAGAWLVSLGASML